MEMTRPIRLDLHVHTHASDGHLPPAEVVRAAVAGGLDVVAITDHDTVAGVGEALKTARDLPVRVVPGVEVSARHGDGEVHILGYFVDPESEALRRHESEALGVRERRMRGMVDRLRGLGVEVSYDEVLEAAGPDAAAIGRPHLARALLARGHIRTFGEAFERYIADGGPAFVRGERPSVGDAIEMIHSAGGVAVWAHPPMEMVEREVPRFAELGMDGVECFRPHNLPADVRRLENLARESGLFPTGGSDWHGPHRSALGDFHVSGERMPELLDLLERAGRGPARRG